MDVKIAHWVKGALDELPPKARQQVIRRLAVDLPSDPAKWLGTVVVPYTTKRSLHFTVRDHSTHPYCWWLVFVVDTGTPNELHVESVRMTDVSNEN